MAPGQLRHCCETFLSQRPIIAIPPLSISDNDRCLLAGLCCLPLLHPGLPPTSWLGEIVVYPDAFRVKQSELADDGILHEWEEDRIGEAWQRGRLVLSWAEVLADVADPTAGFNVAIHEMAHVLDALDGNMDGTPPLPASARRIWADDFQRAFDQFCVCIDAGQATWLDTYAAESPEEFFAVVSEAYFSSPARLFEEMPGLETHLLRYYGPSPATGLRAPAAR